MLQKSIKETFNGRSNLLQRLFFKKETVLIQSDF